LFDHTTIKQKQVRSTSGSRMTDDVHRELA
jgi:hypothetical protein